MSPTEADRAARAVIANHERANAPRSCLSRGVVSLSLCLSSKPGGAPDVLVREHTRLEVTGEKREKETKKEEEEEKKRRIAGTRDCTSRGTSNGTTAARNQSSILVQVLVRIWRDIHSSLLSCTLDPCLLAGIRGNKPGRTPGDTLTGRPYIPKQETR